MRSANELFREMHCTNDFVCMCKLQSNRVMTDLAYVRLKPFNTKTAQYEPELERPETPPKRQMPVSVIDHDTWAVSG